MTRAKGAAFAALLGALVLGGQASCSGTRDCMQFRNCAVDAFAGGGGIRADAGVSGSGGESGSSGGEGGVANDALGVSGSSSSGAAGEAGSAGAPEPPPCDASANPAVEACVIADAYALFVSPTGSNDANLGDGTEAKPFATVSKALAALGPTKPARIYVCADVYLEPAALTIPDRAAIFGGFLCDGGVWSYDATLKSRAQLKSPTSLGATIDSAAHGVTLQDVRIDASNAPQNGTGASSFGLFVKASSRVTLERVEIHSGKGGGGQAGADGESGADGTTSGAAQDGASANCAEAPSTPPSNQAGGTASAAICGSQGGDGGWGFSNPTFQDHQDGSSGFPGVNTYPSPFFNGGGGLGASIVGIYYPGGTGRPGAAGFPGTTGAAAKALGLFTATGYVPASGGSGTPGFPGQGGGGGGASLGTLMCVGASGGAGGMGGCGGDPGTGGIGGGASIALLSWNSAVSIDGCVLVSSAGGAGGRGGNAHAGGSGKPGGLGGASDNVIGIGPGGAGAIGGIGGSGGNGAGGTGGPSIALLYSGTRPTDAQVAATLTAGLGGALGAGGKVGGTSPLLPGPDGQLGKSVTEYAIAP